MYGIIVGNKEFRDYEYPDSETPVAPDAGKWVVCPECGSDSAGFMLWGEGVDMNFRCPDCGAHKGIR